MHYIQKLPDLYFIVGIGRSGTTLLNQILNANSLCLSTPETKFVMTFYEKYAHVSAIDTEALLADIKQYYGVLETKSNATVWHFDQSGFEKQLRETSIINYAAACKLFLLNMHYLGRSNEGVRLIIDKNPAYVPYIPQLLKTFPEAKFIISLRDYRAVLNSGKQSKGNKIITPWVRLLRWRQHFYYIQQLKKNMPDRFFLLKYEDLIGSNELTVRDMCRFLSVPFDEQMLQSHTKIREWVEANTDFLNNSPRQKKKWTDLASPISSGRTEFWRQNLTFEEIAVAEILCGNVGKREGYEPIYVLSFKQKIVVLLKKLPQLLYSLFVYLFFSKLYFFLPLNWRIKIAAKFNN